MTVVANDESGTVEKSGGSGGGTTEEVALKKGPWTAAEDAVLVEYVTKNGEGNWNVVRRNTGLARCGKSCRLRWANHLRPDLKKGAFSPEEEKLILDLHSQFGNKWARMAALLPGRTDNEIKNYWNTRVKRRQRQGLPLYSDDCDRSSTPTMPLTPTTPTKKFEFLYMSHQQPLSPTPPPHSPLQPKPTFSPQPFSHPSHLSSSSPYPFTFQRPTPLLCNPHGFKRYRMSPGCSPFLPPSTQSSFAFQDRTLTNQLAGLEGFRFPAQFYNSNSSQIFQNPLEPSNFATKLDLPSNQISYTIEPDINIDMQINDPTLQTSSDFLGDLLVEAEALACDQTTSKKRSYMSLKEGNEVMGAFDDLSHNSVHWSSPSGSKPKEEAAELSRPMNDDLSTLLAAMPSSNVSDWHNGSAREFFNVHSSSITIDDNFITNTTTIHNDTSDCFSWDNLPALC